MTPASARVVAWRIANPEKYKAQQKRYREKHKDKLSVVRRRNNYSYKYGITIEQYESMLSAQGGVCAICKSSNVKGQRLAVDHCHATGKVRALLCTPCNLTVEHIENCRAPVVDYTTYIKVHKDGD